jgi:hypothetical protein
MVHPYQSHSPESMVGVSKKNMHNIMIGSVVGLSILTMGIEAFGGPNASPRPQVNYPHPTAILTNQNSNPVTISKTTIVGCAIALGMVIYCYR